MACTWLHQCHSVMRWGLSLVRILSNALMITQTNGPSSNQTDAHDVLLHRCTATAFIQMVSRGGPAQWSNIQPCIAWQGGPQAHGGRMHPVWFVR